MRLLILSFAFRNLPTMPNNYNPTTEYQLTSHCHTRRGEILDGTRRSQTPSVSWETGKHALHDDSIPHRIMKFLQQQLNRKATVANIMQSVNLSREVVEWHLRELTKQEIVVML